MKKSVRKGVDLNPFLVRYQQMSGITIGVVEQRIIIRHQKNMFNKDDVRKPYTSENESVRKV